MYGMVLEGYYPESKEIIIKWDYREVRSEIISGVKSTDIAWVRWFVRVDNPTGLENYLKKECDYAGRTRKW
jgi:hypothetical protein